MRFSSALAVAASLLCAGAASAQDRPADKLTFGQEGDDLVVSYPVTINDSAHVLWTRTVEVGKDVYLLYFVFQNSDLYARDGGERRMKTVQVRWRLPGVKQTDREFHVDNRFEPNSAQLKDLLPKLKALAEAGEKKEK
jgi:hypothetical protein